MRRRADSVTGFVLAGGQSRRMGEDKAKLLLEGETMLDRQLRLLRLVCPSVAVLGAPERFPGLQVAVFPDEWPGCGPLGAIYTGLLRAGTEFNLFLGCDLPLMEAGFLGYLCQRALESQSDVTVPESGSGQLEPLCAVYRKRVLSKIRENLRAGQKKVTRFFSEVRCLVISAQEISGCGFTPRIFVNMNTPDDYESVKRQIESGRS
jgi:molybdopterin-guanine dinucleotide biosynthesis protein A